jgi:hypothetical protein
MEFAARLATIDLTLMKMLSCQNKAILALCEQLCINPLKAELTFWHQSFTFKF